MRWPSTFKKPDRTWRWKKRFALFPVRMGSGYLQDHTGDLVWLESFFELQHWQRGDLGWEWSPYGGGVVWTQEPWDLDTKEPIKPKTLPAQRESHDRALGWVAFRLESKKKSITAEDAHRLWDEAFAEVSPRLADDELLAMSKDELAAHLRCRGEEAQVYRAAVPEEDYHRLFVRYSSASITVDPLAAAMAANRVGVLELDEWFRWHRLRGLYPQMKV